MRFIAILLGCAIGVGLRSLNVQALPVTAPLLEARGTPNAVLAAADDPVASALASRLAAVNQKLTEGSLATPTAARASDERVFLGSVQAKNVKQGNWNPFSCVGLLPLTRLLRQ
jgi:hypothetical protein